jgi:hypothetical protein
MHALSCVWCVSWLIFGCKFMAWRGPVSSLESMGSMPIWPRQERRKLTEGSKPIELRHDYGRSDGRGNAGDDPEG